MTPVGIVYVATKQAHYVEEAFLSAASAKQKHAKLAIALFTDQPQNELCKVGVFDSVEFIESVSGFSSGWAEGQLNRLKCLLRSPYEHTLHIDTDTRILGDKLPSLFSLLEEMDVAMVEDPVEHSYARTRTKRGMFNAGFILFRRSEKTQQWLRSWCETTEENFKIAEERPLPNVRCLQHVTEEEVRRNLLRMDQISLMEILSPDRNAFDLKLKILGSEWNYRGNRQTLQKGTTVQILHSQHLRATTHHDLLELAAEWRKVERSELAEKLYNYVASQQPPLYRQKSSYLFLRNIVPAKRPEWATPTLLRGDLYLRYGKLQLAAESFSEAEHDSSQSSAARIGFARIALEMGRLDDAVAIAEQSAREAGASSYAQTVYGRALLAAGRSIDALAPLNAAIKGGCADAAYELGQAWFALKNYKQAAKFYKRALMTDSDHKPAANNLMPAYLGSRQYKQALEHANNLLVDNFWNVPAIAFKSVALTQLSRHEEERTFVAQDRFLKIEELPAPPGFRNVEDFSRVLARSISRTATHYEPSANTAKRGYQSDNLAESTDPAIQVLNKLILEAVKRRSAEIPSSGEHPFERALPRTYYLNSWGVVLDSGGHQTPHIHSKGWLSGVYYVNVPSEIRHDDPTQNGWLILGRSEERWYKDSSGINEVAICPTPGMLVTFPSYMWHHTKTLVSSKKRISYAFDIIPA